MATQSELIYLPNSRPDTWWHYTKDQTKRSNTVRLRGLRKDGEWAKDKTTTIEAVEKKLKQLGAKREPAEPVPITHSEYWKQTLSEKNLELPHRQKEETAEAQETRLLAQFKRDLTKERASVDASKKPDLSRVVQDWSRRLKVSIKTKENEINHFDCSDASRSARSDTGEGWQAYFLEACRCASDDQTSQMHYLTCRSASCNSSRDVFFAAQEVNLSIPSDQNLFVKDREGRIKPDGLGVDKNRALVVFEIKGPQDNLDPLCAITQGVLGALAVDAKRANLTELLRSPPSERSRRPACKVDEDKKIVVYVLVSTRPEPGRLAPAMTKEYDEIVRTLVAACECLSEVSLFRIDKNTRERFTVTTLGRKAKQPWLPTLVATNTWKRSDDGQVH